MLIPLLGAALTGCAAPTLTVSPPPTPAAGHQIVSVVVSEGPVQVVLLVDGVEVEAQELDRAGEFSINTAVLEDGEHPFAVETRGLFQKTARMTGTLLVDNTPPSLLLAQSTVSVDQGRTLGVYARVDELVSQAQATFLESTWLLEKLEEGLLRGVMGVSVSAEEGTHPLSIRVVDYAGNEATGTWAVTVHPGDFPSGGVVRLSPAKKKDMGQVQLTERANAARWDAYQQDLGLPLVEGPMVRPVQGRITSHFGKVRRYNTGVVRHHLGTDLKGRAGDPVVVAHSGIVTLAEELHIYGNAVIVKHGPNVSTSYNHLSQITVDVGQEVVQGMTIGRVGSTGQSTGPHLHWGMSVGGTAVAAEQWTDRDFSQPLPGDFEPGLPPDPSLAPAPGPSAEAAESE